MVKDKFFILFLLISFNLLGQEYIPKSEGEIIRHKYYTLSYNEDHEQANWVHYKLDPNFLIGTTPRINSFRSDPYVSTKSSELSDYKGSGYDRGHLAPAADMKFNSVAMSESFYMSNMSPQNPSFNRGIWRKLEQLVRDWGREGEIFITTGGVLLYEYLGSIGSNKVTIPSKFYKIVYSSHKNSMIGFLVPNKKCNFKLESFVVEVDSIEKITGINFYEDLPDNMENLLESEINLKKWKFN